MPGFNQFINTRKWMFHGLLAGFFLTCSFKEGFSQDPPKKQMVTKKKKKTAPSKPKKKQKEIAKKASTVKPEQSTSIVVEQNKAETIKLSESVSEIFVANPEIADIQLNEPTTAYVFGRKIGNTTVFATNKQGEVILKLQLRVTHDLKQLKETVQSSFPEEQVSFDSTPGGIILKGTPSSPQVAKNIENIATGFLDKEGKLTNNMAIGSPIQILLKVKIAEINRSVLHKFEINWGALIDSPRNMTYGLLMGRDPFNATTGNFNRATSTSQINSYGARYSNGANSYTALLDALDQEGLGTILAEPNLITASGETASFLVGGEYPYPVPQDQNITIEFKQFGISLSFTPTVLSSNMINLRVRPEVSELDETSSISIPMGTSGSVVKVPGLKTRRAETSVELGDGQSLAIAGLISSKMANSYGSLPGVDNIPILGALFRSTSFQRDQTELVIIVTPHVVKPTSSPQALGLPTDKIRHASALETLFSQRLNRPHCQEEGNEKCHPDPFYGAAGFSVEG